MTEISKTYKVMLIINMVACFVYGVLYAFLWWIWLDVIDNTVMPPFYAQFFGGFLILALIWFLRIILQKMSWEKALYFVEFMLFILCVMLLYETYTILFVFKDMSQIARTNSIVSTSVVSVLLILNLIFYYIEIGKHK